MKLRIANMSAPQIAEAVGGSLNQDAHVESVSTDTRTIREHSLFVPLVGERFDGHDYLEKAREQGASLVISSRPSDEQATISVPDTLVALQDLGHALWKAANEEGMRTIALTGSNGKTTTKELVALFLRAGGPNVHATLGNLNNHIGVPLTLCSLPEETDIAVVEMGCNQFGDISELIGYAPGDLRLITSIGAAHLEILGDLEGVRRAKSELFENANQDTVALVPEAERGHLKLQDFPGEIYSVGMEENADFRFEIIERSEGVQRLRVWAKDRSFEFSLHLPGEHNAANATMAWACTVIMDVDLAPGALQTELDALTLPGGRLRQINHGDWEFIDDAYNANPSSMLASYRSFLELIEGRESSHIVAVLGEMLELGDGAELLHTQVARDLADLGGANVFVFVGRYADVMAKAASARTDAQCLAAKEVADAARVIRQSGPSLVFLKASRGARLERVVEILVNESVS